VVATAAADCLTRIITVSLVAVTAGAPRDRAGKTVNPWPNIGAALIRIKAWPPSSRYGLVGGPRTLCRPGLVRFPGGASSRTLSGTPLITRQILFGETGGKSRAPQSWRKGSRGLQVERRISGSEKSHKHQGRTRTLRPTPAKPRLGATAAGFRTRRSSGS
jgi:hypothetical protein